jgi:urea transport system ATP-binding protein
MLSIQHLEVGYGGGPVLRGVDIRVEPGQVVCLMGRNGVGKTTLLKSVMGLLRPVGGKVLWNDSDITRSSTDQRARSGIGYVPQGREVFPQLSVEENLMLGLEASPVKPKRGYPDKLPDEPFDMFPMLGKMLHRKGGSLSGGQQQQLAIGRALVMQPKLLLLDEPMEGIQPSVVQEIERAIEKIKSERKIAVLLVEQSLSFATQIADYYYILDRGQVVANGPGEELTEDLAKQHLTV